MDAAADKAIDTYTPVRSVSAPESPFDGRLARGAVGGTVLLVDRDLLADWPGWSAEPGEHVLAPLDVIRRLDGHDVVLPHLSERLDRFVARRADGAPLSDGETVTLAVSVLRGLSTAASRATADAPGEWWLTDEARPVLVEGVGGDSARRASALLLAEVAQTVSPPRRTVVAALAALAGDDTVRARDLDAAEEDLFALGPAEALVTDVIAPLRARVRPQATAAAVDEADAAPRGLWHSLARSVDAHLADTASDAMTTVWRRLRHGDGSRRRPLLLAAGLAAAVVAVGLTWPSDEDPSAAAPRRSDATPVAETEAPRPEGNAPTAEAPTASAPPAEPDLALAELLDTWRTCGEPCAADVLEDASRAVGGGVAHLDAAERSIGLVDDLGGLAVLRVQGADGTAPHLVTVVQTEEGWRIRDVYEAADPPG